MAQSGIFISGTDTGIGKTTVSAFLMAALKSAHASPHYYKPVQTGSDDDVLTVSRLAMLDADEYSEPTYAFAEPAAPYWAARLENQEVHLSHLSQSWKQLCEIHPQSQHWVVEGAGGILVPLTVRETIRDLIVELGLPLLLVASTRLGTLNHTLLTIEAAEKAQIGLKGIVLVGENDDGRTQSILSQFTSVPVLTRVPLFQELTPQLIRSEAREYFPMRILAQIFPDLLVG